MIIKGLIKDYHAKINMVIINKMFIKDHYTIKTKTNCFTTESKT